MDATGIICEYDPFHNGHRAQLEKVRERFGGSPVICVMSGNFVQRGSFAVFDKYARASCAVSSGADLVLELIFPFSSAGAQRFALSGISVLSRLGCVKNLVFGSESGDAERISDIAGILSSAEFEKELAHIIKSNPRVPYARARALCASRFGIEEDEISSPNNILAAEYLRASSSLGFHPNVFTHKRTDAENVKSASRIRELILSGDPWETFVPENARAEKEASPVLPDALGSAVIYHLCSSDTENIAACSACRGLAFTLKKAAKDSLTLSELYEKASSGAYTNARIRRAALFSFLGIKESEFALDAGYARAKDKSEKPLGTLPAYTCVLAFSERGRRLIREISRVSSIPVFTKPAMASRSCDPEIKRQYEVCERAEKAYSLAAGKRSWIKRPNGAGTYINSQKNPEEI